MSEIDTVLTQAETAAKANMDAEDSAMTLLVTLSKTIADLKVSGSDPETVKRIKSLSDSLNSKAAQLAAAIVAGTPADPSADPSVDPTVVDKRDLRI